jgi:DNA-binding MarR family transcriptional regulator
LRVKAVPRRSIRSVKAWARAQVRGTARDGNGQGSPAFARESAFCACEPRALAELRYRIRCFLTFSDVEARAANIEAQQHQLLLVLKALQPPQRPTIRVVAERLQIQHNSTVELVRRAVERGLVERGTGSDDRREARLRVTSQGERLLRRLSLAHRRELRSAAPVESVIAAPS